MPPRSYLYCLSPIGEGTPYIESITSYVMRLAQAHCLTTGNLLIHEILPLYNRAYLIGQLHNISNFWRTAAVLHSTNSSTRDFVQILEKLTLRSDLTFLTMLSWKEIISWRGLIKQKRAWCPSCYNHWQANRQVVYEPLIWSLEVLSICPVHKTPLARNCPNSKCAQSQPFLANKARPGYCAYCESWLGSSFETSSRDASQINQDEVNWQSWIITVLEELFANIPQITQLSLNNFSMAINNYVQNAADGNMSAAVRQLQVSDVTLLFWKRGEQFPQLGTLLQVCHQLGVSPLQFLSGVGFGEVSPKNRLWTGYQGWARPKEHYRKFENEKIEQTLKSQLEEDNKQILSMVAIAKNLGYDGSHLYKHYPDLCRSISQHFQNYRRQKSFTKKQNQFEDIRKAIVTIAEQNLYPTQGRVKQLLSQPGIMRHPEAQTVWHQTIQNSQNSLTQT